MTDITVQPDYTNLQFQIWKDGKPVNLGLPAEVQAAMIQTVQNDLRRELLKQFENPKTMLEAMAHMQENGII